MMQSILAALLLLAVAQPPSIETVRAQYLQAINDSDAADALAESLESSDLSAQPLLRGYLGTAYCLQAEHAFNPYNKYKLFNKGTEQLEAAIKAAPSIAELRFLRFTVQEHAPGFLNYNSNLSEDKKAIINHLLEAEPGSGNFVLMRNHLLASEECTSEERTTLLAISMPASNAQAQ